MLAVISILFFFAANLIQAPPDVPADRGAVVVSTKNGGVRWRANWTMEPFEKDGRKAVRFTERGEGHISSFAGEVRWSLESVWSAADGLQPLDSEKITTNAAGAYLATERKRFDWTTNTVRFQRQTAAGPPELKSLVVPPDTLAVEGIAGVLRFLPFQRMGSFATHLLSNEPRLYTVTFELRGRERVKTPAGQFECYKVQMVPQLGLLNVIRSFLPKAYFWFTVAPPHFWVRYEGPENGPGTPDIVMELDRAR
jgi:hypothetical protein